MNIPKPERTPAVISFLTIHKEYSQIHDGRAIVAGFMLNRVQKELHDAIKMLQATYADIDRLREPIAPPPPKRRAKKIDVPK